MYHFISGYTAKVAGTEVGVNEPQATFSRLLRRARSWCWHPTKYAEMLADKMQQAQGRTPGSSTPAGPAAPYGVGSRIKLTHTRAIIDAIHSGALADVAVTKEPVFNLSVPMHCPGVPDEILLPERTWRDRDAYLQSAAKLAGLFRDNFAKYSDHATAEVRASGPKL